MYKYKNKDQDGEEKRENKQEDVVKGFCMPQGSNTHSFYLHTGSRTQTVCRRAGVLNMLLIVPDSWTLGFSPFDLRPERF